LKILYERKHDREILLGHRHRSARLAVNDWNRRTPVPLPGNAPVVQTIMNDRFGRAVSRQELQDCLLCRFDAETVEHSGIDQGA